MATAKKKAASTASNSHAARQIHVAKPHTRARIEHRAMLQKKAEPIAEALSTYNGEYTAELGEALFKFIVEGIGLDNITTLPNMPPLYDMLKWIADEQHPFSKVYKDAKQLLIALYEERGRDVALRPMKTVLRRRYQVVTKDGEVEDLEEEREVDNVERSKLAFAAYQWSLSHLAPKKHGRRAEDEGGGKNEQLEALFNSLKQGPAQ
jgi:hypothetical protein